jgi:hypothetical protein
MFRGVKFEVFDVSLNGNNLIYSYDGDDINLKFKNVIVKKKDIVKKIGPYMDESLLRVFEGYSEDLYFDMTAKIKTHTQNKNNILRVEKLILDAKYIGRIELNFDLNNKKGLIENLEINYRDQGFFEKYLYTYSMLQHTSTKKALDFLIEEMQYKYKISKDIEHKIRSFFLGGYQFDYSFTERFKV